MERRVFLTRHGYVDNPDNIIYGRLPGFNLNVEGKAQMERLAQALKEDGVVLSKIYASPLERTIQSAKIIGEKLGVEVEEDEALLEVEAGPLEGKAWWQHIPLYLKHGVNVYSERYVQMGMESTDSITERMRRSLEAKLAKTEGDFMLVSHADPINILIWSYVYPEKDFGKSSLWRRMENYPVRGKVKVLVFDSDGNFLRLIGRKRWFRGGEDP